MLRENIEILNNADQGCNLDSSQISIELSTGDEDAEIDTAINSEAIKAKEEEWNAEREENNKK